MIVAFAIAVLLTLSAAGDVNAGDISGAEIIGGNGGLTFGIDASGRMTTCRWPSPGAANQLSRSQRVTDGAMWGIRFGDGPIQWIASDKNVVSRTYGDEWPLVCTTIKLPNGATAVHETFAHPERDVLAWRVAVRGISQAPQFYWYSNLSPCTRNPIEVPPDCVPDYLDDFAAFSDDCGKTIFHFRPQKPANKDWVRAEQIAQRNLPATSWNEFGPGVWIALSFTNTVDGYQVGSVYGDTCAFRSANAGRLSGNSAAFGLCNSAAALSAEFLDDAYIATAMGGFGADRTAAVSNLAYAEENGYLRMKIESENHWRERMRRAKIPFINHPQLYSACKRDVMQMLLYTDRTTAAVVRMPGSLDVARKSAWTGLALDLAGFGSIAEQRTRLYAMSVREKDAPGMPAGSVPAALAYTGQEALPHVVLDAEAGAWWLGSVWKHATTLDEPARRDYLNSLWPETGLAANFLSKWVDQRDKQPLHSFDPQLMRDNQRPETILVSYMGMDAALRIAAALEQAPREEWTRRKRELDTLIRLNFIDESGKWSSNIILPYWHAEFAETELPDWMEEIEKRLQRNDNGALCDAALVTQDDRAASDLQSRLLNDPLTIRADSFDAARHFIAASLIYAAQPPSAEDVPHF